MMAGTLAGMRVMIVEDELLVAMLIEEMLIDEGCVVVGPFSNLAEALQAATEVTVDIAVLDVNLRGEKVYPVAKLLAQRGIPFLLLSGYGNDAIPYDHPDWRAFSKPFQAAELVNVLAGQIVGAKRPRSILEATQRQEVP